MKHVTLLLALLLTGFLNAQESFPYKRPELLLNTEVTVKPLSPGGEEVLGGHENFYSDSSRYKIYKENNQGKTSSSSLANRTFKVVEAKSMPESSYPYYVFTLEDTATKEKVYYKYGIRQSRRDVYPFTVTGGLNLPADFYCDYVETYGGDNPTYFMEWISGYKLEKHITNGKAVYHLILQTDGIPASDEGIVITLENDLSITRPKHPILRGRRTLGSFDLTTKELEMLKNNKITGFTLGKAKGLISDKEMRALKEGITCLMSK